MNKQNSYDEEFKKGAIGLVVEQGYTYREASESLGVNIWTLRGWVRKHRDERESEFGERQNDAAAELKKLRQDNRRLRMENEILKKAAAYFAKESL